MCGGLGIGGITHLKAACLRRIPPDGGIVGEGASSSSVRQLNE